METNSMALAKSILERLIAKDRVDDDVKAELELCVNKLIDQHEYCRAVEYQFVAMIRALKNDRYQPDIIASCGYPDTYERAYIDEVLAARRKLLAEGGQQCLMCGNISPASAATCVACCMDFKVLEERYDRHYAQSGKKPA